MDQPVVFGSKAARILQEAVRQIGDAPLTAPHDQYAPPPDVSSPEVHPVLITSATKNANGYQPGIVLSIGTQTLPWTPDGLGNCWVRGLNGEPLAATEYHCRRYGDNDTDGLPVFVPMQVSPWLGADYTSQGGAVTILPSSIFRPGLINKITDSAALGGGQGFQPNPVSGTVLVVPPGYDGHYLIIARADIIFPALTIIPSEGSFALSPLGGLSMDVSYGTGSPDVGSLLIHDALGASTIGGIGGVTGTSSQALRAVANANLSAGDNVGPMSFSSTFPVNCTFLAARLTLVRLSDRAS